MERGPKTIVLTAPNIKSKPGEGFREQILAVNDSPRAGQEWHIGNVFFNFPLASRSLTQNLSGEVVTYGFHIRLLIGGVVVAEQAFLESQTKPGEGQQQFIAVGSLEPFIPAIVHAGQNVEIEYTMGSNNPAFGMFSTGQGSIVINYNLAGRGK